ncbi:response regulator [Marinobacteraceae bacterium S3BR75-40.1]
MARAQALIVDDSSTARIMLARLLKRIDVESQGVSSAEDALDYLKRHEAPDVIFLDHLLPGMDGFEALRELKHQPETRDIPVFMYTSQNAERYLEEAQALGARGVIGKQADRNELYRRLEAVLESRYATNGGTAEPVPDTVASHPVDLAATSWDETQLRRITGRVSTLEIAFEEVNDELSQLRKSHGHQRVELEMEIDRLRRALRWTGGLLALLIVVVGFAFWSQLEHVTGALDNIESQFGLIREILAHLMELSNP